MASTITGEMNPNIGEACVLAAPPNRQLPDGHAQRGSGIGEILRNCAGLAGQAVEVAKLSAIRTYYRARHGAVESYSAGTRRTQEMATRTWNRAGDLKRQHPVRVLAVVAGTAFLAGAVSRMWRSRGL